MASHSHMTELAEMLSQFRRENFLCDTLLCASDKEMKAHSVLLAAVSPVFKSAFELSGTAGMYQINLPEIDSTVLEIALHFIYTGTLLLPSCYALPGELPKLFAMMQQLGLEPQQFDGCEMKFKSSSDVAGDGIVISIEDCSTGEISTSSEAPACSSALSKDSDSDDMIKTEGSKEESVSSKTNSRIVKDVGVEHAATSPDASDDAINSTDCVTVTADCNEQVISEPDKDVGEVLPNHSDKAAGTKPLEFVPPACPTVQLPTLKIEPSVKKEFSPNKTPQIFLVQLPANSTLEAFQDQVSSQLAPTGAMKKMYCCPTCGSVFVCKATFDQHQQIHAGEKPYICEFCDKSFTMKSNLERHEKRHTGIRPHLCELCGKGFIQKTALQYHMKIHEDEIGADVYKQGEIYSCSACSLAFNRGANLRKHIQKVHLNQNVKIEQNETKISEKKSLLCDLCGKGFASVNSLKLHKMQHTGEKPFVCSVCGKAFVVKAQLQYHSRLHTGEKPFVCPTCGKGFVGKLGLTQHIRTHTGERPYICTVCGKGFTQSTHLKGHMRSHTGEKPNICHLCGKAYKNRLDLRFHYSRIHEMNITRPKPHIIKIEQSF